MLLDVDQFCRGNYPIQRCLRRLKRQCFINKQHLILERLDQIPFLITTSYHRNFLLQPSDHRRIIVLDKRDGNVLLDTKDEPGEAAFHSMLIDTAGRHVDLISNAERLRLKATAAAN